MRFFELKGTELDLARLTVLEHHPVCSITKTYEETGWGEGIGGRWTYCFTPTSVGTSCILKCSCGFEKDVTDYKSW